MVTQACRMNYNYTAYWYGTWLLEKYIYYLYIYTHSIQLTFLCFRFSKREIEYLIRFAESFKGDDFPNRDPDTGSLTMTGYIPLVNNLTKYGWTFVAVFHAIQSTLRMLTSRSMIFTTWYPFDASISPLYEIINLSQVHCRLSSMLCSKIWATQTNMDRVWSC
jgi:hypothetical protein